jgi:hypothetical protein
MPRTSFSEALLARITDPTRAAAIMGDLEELSTTRGRLYFWTGYARTLISLTWRTPVAFAAGIVILNLLTSFVERWIIHHPTSWRTTLHDTPAIFQIGPLLATLTIPLWFAVPYAIVRYGLRDRFVRLAAAALLLTTGTFLYIPFASLASALLALAILIAALFSTTWRRPAIVLIATVATGAAAFAAFLSAAAIGFQFVIEYVRIPQFRLLFWEIAVLTSALIVALVCSRLHRWLLQAPSNRDSALA